MYFSDRLYSSMSNNVRENTVYNIYMKNNGTVTQSPKIGKKSLYQSEKAEYCDDFNQYEWYIYSK